jgi:hypothetical protein
MATSLELLTAVETAISTILNGGAVQRFVVRGRDISLCSLSELWQIRRELKGEVEQEDVGTSVILARLTPM